MKILITGGAGYIGSHTVHFLVGNGFKPEDIIVFDNLVYGHRESLPEGVTLMVGDLLNKSEIHKVFEKNQIEAVIHFAAYAFVGESMTDPGKYFENNITGGVNLLEEMVKAKCHKIVLSSTCAVYGLPKKVPITESAKLNPISPYGESKLALEKILDWYWKIHKIRSVSLRYFNAAGAAFGVGEQHEPETHLIPLVISSALMGTQVSVFGADYETPDGTCIRDYIHVVDLADAHLRAINYLADHNVSEKINLGTGTGTSVKEILALVEKVSGKKLKTSYIDRRPGDPDALIADASKARKILNWNTKYSSKQIIEDAYRWHSLKEHTNNH